MSNTAVNTHMPLNFYKMTVSISPIWISGDSILQKLDSETRFTSNSILLLTSYGTIRH
jgi:hypothetical protein